MCSYWEAAYLAAGPGIPYRRPTVFPSCSRGEATDFPRVRFGGPGNVRGEASQIPRPSPLATSAASSAPMKGASAM